MQAWLRFSAISAVLLPLNACFTDPEDDDSSSDSAEGHDEDNTDDGSTTGTDTDTADGDGSDTNDTNDTNDTGTGTNTDVVPTCEEYCDILMDHCQNDLAQFSTNAACLAVCAVLPPGDPGDDLGNSVACRYFHAVNAGEAPEVSCAHAGPAGSGVCGGGCESFCHLQGELCTGEHQQYTNTAECTAECDTFPTTENFNTATADDDSFNCRLKHLTYASLDPVTHCGHIVAESETCETPLSDHQHGTADTTSVVPPR